MVLTQERSSKIVRLANSCLHVIGVSSIAITIVGLSIPTFYRDKSNFWDVMKNWGAIGLIGGSGYSLFWCSKQLEQIQPELNAIEKAELMQGKHSIASWLYHANQLQSDIAKSVTAENSPIQQNHQAEMLEAAYRQGLQEGYEEAVNSLPSVENAISRDGETGKVMEISNLSPELIEMVQVEILDGKSESKIVMETLGMRGRNYKRGKEIVRQIKRLMNEDQRN